MRGQSLGRFVEVGNAKESKNNMGVAQGGRRISDGLTG